MDLFTTRLLCLAHCTYIITAQCNPSYLSSISQSTTPRPTELIFITTQYGGSGGDNYGIYLSQGRINSINDWGIYRDQTSIVNNTLFITEWDADHKNLEGYMTAGGQLIQFGDGEMGNGGGALPNCTPFVLPCNEYIVAYRIYSSIEYIHGLSFYTSSGCKYECVGNNQHTLYPVSDSGVVSYYYNNVDFWYLTGFISYAGAILDGVKFEFTQFTSADSCEPSQSPTDLPTENTLFPTSGPSFAPSTEPSVSPSKSTTSDPTEAPSKAPSNYPSVSTEAFFLSISDMIIIVVVIGSIVIVCGALLYFYARKVTRSAPLKSPEPNVDKQDVIKATPHSTTAGRRLTNDLAEGDEVNRNDDGNKQQNKPVCLERVKSLSMSDDQQNINPEGHNAVISTEVTHDGHIYNMAQDEFVIEANSLDGDL